MDEESEPLEREPAPKMSMTPSWVMLGFVLGALFVVALPPLKKPEPPSLVPAPSIEPAAKTKSAPPLLSTIEAVFDAWGENAVWENDTTEVALWDSEKNDFVDFYEVHRIGEHKYFRSLTRLTRRVVTHKNLPENCPLQFTESEEHYREWLQQGRPERARPSSENR